MADDKGNPFEAIKRLVGNESMDVEDIKGYSPWMTNKYFSNSREYIFASEMANKITDPEMNRAFWEGVLNNAKASYIPWIKNQPRDIENCLLLSKIYNISPTKSKDYEKLLDEDDLKQIKLELSRKKQ